MASPLCTRTFCMSDDLFSGFQSTVNLTHVGNLGQIVDEVKYKLYFTLKQMHMIDLCKKLEHKNFHIHDVTLDDIFCSDPSKVFYICSHCDDKGTA